MIEYSEDFLVSLIFRKEGSVAWRASIFAIPTSLLTLFILYLDEISPGFREDHGLKELASSQLWAVSTSVLAILLAFRTNRAMARFWEGTGLLHQMRGEWFDSVSCCVTFSRAALPTKFVDVHEFRHTIVRLMSLCHGSALEEIAGNEGGGRLETIDSFGLSVKTLKHLKECKVSHHFNTVEVLLHMIQSLITKNLDDGVLKIPPPILSRVYQTLSRGFVNLLNAKKIADTRFPFPYAQTIAFLLFLNMVLTPMMISCLISSKILAPIFAFVPIFGMFSLNFIGVELENPFGSDDNDLPLDHFQTEMNKCLLMLLEDNADLIAGVSKQRCIREFSKLKGSMRPSELHGHKPGMAPRPSTTQPFRRLSQFEDLLGGRDDDEASNLSSPHGSEAVNPYAFLLEREGGHPGMPKPKAAAAPAPVPSPAQVKPPPESPAPAQPAEVKRTAEAAAEREASPGPPPPPTQVERKMIAGVPEEVEPKARVEPKLGAAHTQLIADSIKDCNDVLLDVTEYDRALQELKEIIRTQLVSEFNRSITALKDFSDAINALPQSASEKAKAAQVRWKQLLDSDQIMRDAFNKGGVLRESSGGTSAMRPATSPLGSLPLSL